MATTTRPMTVHLYPTHGVQVTDSTELPTPAAPTIGGEAPLASYRVIASSLVGAVRAALLAAYQQQHQQAAPQDTAAGYRFMVETGSPVDLNLNRLATQADTHASDIIERAINCYANLKDASDDGYVYVKRRATATSQLSVRKVALP